MAAIQGKDFILWLFDNGVYYPIACNKSVTLTTTLDLLNAVTAGSGKWKVFVPDLLGFAIAADGITALGVDWSIPRLRAEIQFNRVTLLFSFVGTDNAGNTVTYSGNIFAAQIDEAGTINEFATYTLTAQGSGELTIDYTPFDPDPNTGGGVNVFNADAAEGQTQFVSATLKNKKILLVFNDGLEYRAINAAPDPSRKEVQYIADDGSGNGVLNFPIGLTAGQMVDVLYQNV